MMYADFLWLTALIAATCYILLLAGLVLRRHLVRRQTALVELSILRKPRKHNGKINGTAVVGGGSIAGLLTARICHDYFDRVVIVEPEEWLFSEEGLSTRPWETLRKRSRIIQYDSLQVVQAMGFRIMQALFPSLDAECKAGAINILPCDFKSLLWGLSPIIPYAEYNGNLPKTTFVSRPGFESLIRRLVLDRESFPNILNVGGIITGIKRDPNNHSYIKSVSVQKSDSIIDIDATLVVDCTGPAAAGLKWLRAANFGELDSTSAASLPIDELKVHYDHKMRYSTLHFDISDDLGERLPIPGGWGNAGSIFSCFTDFQVDNKVIYCLRVEGKRIQICCGGWGNIELPKTLTDVQNFAGSMVVTNPLPSWFFRLLEMLHQVMGSMMVDCLRVPPAYYVRYHKAGNLPPNYIAIGDSVMVLNPVFGHGTTKAMFGVLSAESLLRSTCDAVEKPPSALQKDFSSRFFDVQNAKIKPLWQGSKIVDYGYPSTIPARGETLNNGALLRWYFRQLLFASFWDEQAGSTIWHVQLLLAPPIDYFRFGLLVKVFWIAITHAPI